MLASAACLGSNLNLSQKQSLQMWLDFLFFLFWTVEVWMTVFIIRFKYFLTCYHRYSCTV